MLHEEEESVNLQSGIEVGAECMESRRRGSASVPTKRPSLSSECQTIVVQCCMSLS